MIIEVRIKTNIMQDWPDIEPQIYNLHPRQLPNVEIEKILRRRQGGPFVEVRWNWQESMQGHYIS